MNLQNQTENDIRAFARDLPLLKMNNINSLFYEMLPLCGFGPTLAFSRFLSLQNKICFGSHALINAFRINHKSLWGIDLENSCWERRMYFENAIEAYNKVVDYIYVILYFNFELYEIIDKKRIKTKDDISEISKNINIIKRKKINEWVSNNELTKDFSVEFADYKNFTCDMRNLANDIKHRGCITVEGFELPRFAGVLKVIEGHEIDINDLVSEIKIDLDSEISKLAQIHKRTFELQKSLYKLCNFQRRLQDFLDKQMP